MARIFSFLLWSVVFCAALLLIDLILVHVPLSAPGFKESQRFYREFRQRLLTLRTPAPPAPSIETIIEQNTAPVPPAPAADQPPPRLERVEPVATPAAAPATPRPVKPAPAPTDAPGKVKPAAVTPATAVAAPATRAATKPAATAAAVPRKSPATAPGRSSGYVYADDTGELHFVDRLDQVPARYRRESQPLGN